MTETDVAPRDRVATTELTEITFATGLPGFPHSTRFGLLRWGADPDLSLLVDLDDPETRFLVAPPALFFPDYEIVVDDATCDALELYAAEHALLLVILNLTDSDRPTANLLGPIVVNVANRRAVQAVLSDVAYAARTPLPRP